MPSTMELPAHHLWLLLWLLLSHLSDQIFAACPRGCRCYPTFVDCTYSNLEAVPWDLPDPVGLSILRIQGNHIPALVSEIVSYANLQQLELPNNGILRIEDNVFQSLPKLKKLRLSGNRLERVTSQTFKGLASLEELDLADNNLGDIQESLFTDLQKLQSLYLSGNQISALSPIAFLGLVNLKYLHLDNNRLEEVLPETLGQASNLRSLKLSNNAITQVPSDTFVDLKALQILYLDGNSITTISETAFGDKYDNRLEWLYLQNNDFAVIPTDAISRLKSIEIIDLSGNPIAIIEPDAFKGLDKLEMVSLDAMPKLEVIRSYSFSSLQSLSSVSLHSNPKLRSIELDAFLASDKLSDVDLHNTGLTTLNSELLKWENMGQLDLRFNAWRCDCHLAFLPQVLQGLRNHTLRTQVFCSEPHELEGHSISELEEHQLQCDVRVKKLEAEVMSERVVIIIIAAVSCLLIGITGALMYRSRYSSCGQAPLPRYGVRRSAAAMLPGPGDEGGHSDDRVNITDPDADDDAGDQLNAQQASDQEVEV